MSTINQNESNNNAMALEDKSYWDNLLKMISKNLKGVIFLIYFQALLRVTILAVVWVVLLGSGFFQNQRTFLLIVLGVYIYIEVGSVLVKVRKIKEQYHLLNTPDHERDVR